MAGLDHHGVRAPKLPCPMLPAKHGPAQQLKHAKDGLLVAEGNRVQAQPPGQVLKHRRGPWEGPGRTPASAIWGPPWAGRRRGSPEQGGRGLRVWHSAVHMGGPVALALSGPGVTGCLSCSGEPDRGFGSRLQGLGTQCRQLRAPPSPLWGSPQMGEGKSHSTLALHVVSKSTWSSARPELTPGLPPRPAPLLHR